MTSGPAAAGSMALDSSLLHPQPPRKHHCRTPTDPWAPFACRPQHGQRSLTGSKPKPQRFGLQPCASARLSGHIPWALTTLRGLWLLTQDQPQGDPSHIAQPTSTVGLMCRAWGAREPVQDTPNPQKKKKKLSNYSPAAAPFQLPRVPGSTRMGAFGSVLAR